MKNLAIMAGGFKHDLMMISETVTCLGHRRPA